MPRLGVSKGVCPLRGDIPRGWPPWRSRRGRLQSRAYDGREAYVNQYVDQPSGEPARPSQVRRHRACEVERPLYDPGARKNTAMSSDFRIGDAVEVFANEAPRSSLLRRSSHFDYEGLKLRGILRSSSKPLPCFAKATEGSPRRRIMRAGQRPDASAAESNWILQEVKMIQLRSCWLSFCLRVSPRHRVFEGIARWIFQSQLENHAGTPIALLSLKESNETKNSRSDPEPRLPPPIPALGKDQ